MAEETKAAKLKDTVAKKYELTVANKEFVFKLKKINIEEIDLDQAEQLVKDGFPFLKPIEKAADKPASK